MNAIRQPAEKKSRKQDKAGVSGKRRWTGVAAASQVQDQESGDDGVVDVHQSHGDPRGNERAAQPSSAARVLRGLVILGNLRQQSGGGKREHNLKTSGAMKGA